MFKRIAYYASVVIVNLALITSSLASELDTYFDENIIDFQREYDKRLRDAPETLTVFDSQYIAQSGALNVADLLERVVGVHITRKFYGASANTQVRGLESGWLILHNGIRLERTLPELLALPVADIRRLEVLKGSYYTLYGSTSGTINIITYGPEQRSSAVGASVGTLDTKELWVRKSDAVGNIGYSAYLYGFGTDGNDAIIERDRQTLLDEELGTDASRAPAPGNFERTIVDGRFTIEIGDHWSFTQYINKRQSGLGVGLLQALDPNGEENLERFSSDLRYQNTFGDYRFNGILVFNKIEASYIDAQLLPPGTLGNLFPDGVIQTYGNTGTETTVSAIVTRIIGDHKFEVGIGGEYGKVDVDFDRRNYTIQNGSPIPVPVGEITDFRDTFPLFAKSWSGSEAHFLFRHIFNINDDVSLDYGFRSDYDNDYGAIVSPRFNLRVSAGLNTDLSAEYGESWVVPSTIQLTSTGIFSPRGNLDLEPAKTRHMQFTAKHQYSNRLGLEAGFFIHNRTDSIDDVPDETSPNGRAFMNIKENETGYGLDFLAKWQQSEKLNIALGGSIQNSDSSDSGSLIAPKLLPHVELNYAPTALWNINTTVISVVDRDRRVGDERDAISNYAVTNLAVTRKSAFNAFDVNLNIQNLFGAEAREDIHRDLLDDLPYYPQTVSIGIRKEF